MHMLEFTDQPTQCSDDCLAMPGKDPLTGEAELVLDYVLRLPFDTATCFYRAPEVDEPSADPHAYIAEYDCLDGDTCIEIQHFGTKPAYVDGFVMRHPEGAPATIDGLKACITILDLGAESGIPLASGRYGLPTATLYAYDDLVLAQVYDRGGAASPLAIAASDAAHADALHTFIGCLDMLSEIEASFACDENGDPVVIELPAGFFYIQKIVEGDAPLS